MDDATAPEHGGVPDGFLVRAPGWLPAILWAAFALNVASLAFSFEVSTLLVAFAMAVLAVVQQSWRGEIRPDGLTFRNAVGVDWERSWDELRPGVEVRRPKKVGTLVRGRLRTGRRVAIANGRVTTLSGGEVAPETAQQMMQVWADAGTGAPTSD